MSDNKLEKRIAGTVQAAAAVAIAKPLDIKVYPKAQASEEDEEKALEENTIGHDAGKSDAIRDGGDDVSSGGRGDRGDS